MAGSEASKKKIRDNIGAASAGDYEPKMAETIAIAARGTDGKELDSPISPCGACRQVLLEYETLAGADVPVILAGAGRCFIFPSVKSLLPYCFSEF